MHTKSADLESYDRFARIYRKFWGPTTQRRMFPIVKEHGLRHLKAGDCIVDLCCGTGELTHSLQEQGFKLLGVDGSHGMIGEAQAQFPRTAYQVAELLKFRADAAFALAVCLSDSLNHLNSLDEVTTVFENVLAALKPGGTFLFDMNDTEGFVARWKGKTFAIEDADTFVTARSRFDEALQVATMKVTAFHRGGSSSWERDDFTFTQRAFDVAAIRDRLIRVGFTDVKQFPDPTPEHPDQGRIFFVGSKAGD